MKETKLWLAWIWDVGPRLVQVREIRPELAWIREVCPWLAWIRKEVFLEKE
jgi:hypothetical protein